ncbi:DUF3572 family protein [uncultured Sphingomonas sp.]|uniref:DUF3572 family protein n=1 Tax=uncultured Sphingomonas sp. TaxID=158754 RepID=UPI0025D4C003|nr:DUF3572 family protein [uncultured Sphingomonas sp.]
MINPASNNDDPLTVALHALAVTIRDERRAERLLDLSGIAPADLRERADDPQLLSAVLRFLEAHEPDLLAVAAELGRKPEELVAARSALEA